MFMTGSCVIMLWLIFDGPAELCVRITLGLTEIYAGDIGSTKVGAFYDRSLQCCTTKISTIKLGPAEISPCEISSAQIGFTQVRVGQDGLPHRCSLQISLNEAGFHKCGAR